MVLHRHIIIMMMSKPRVCGVGGVGPLRGRRPGRHMKKLLGLLWNHAAGRPVGRSVGRLCFVSGRISDWFERMCLLIGVVCGTAGRWVGSVGAGLIYCVARR